MRVRAGFTLMEVLAVMVLGAIVAGTAAPRLSTGLAQSRLKRAAAVVSSDMRLAHTLAGRQRAPVTLSVDGTAGVVRIARTIAPNTVLSERQIAGAGGFGISSLSASTASIVVFPHGLASGDMVVTLVAGDRSTTVTLKRAGLVRVGAQ